MLMGTSRLYRFADRNPAIQIRATSYTHDALVLGNFRRFIAINGALEVDLTGQVNAETARGRHIALVGGQMDFIRSRGESGDTSDMRQDGAEVFVLDNACLRNLPQLVEGGVRQVEPAVADRQPAVGIIDNGDALAAELAGDLVRLDQKHDFVVLQGQVIGNRSLLAPGEDIGEIVAAVFTTLFVWIAWH
jgi:hypothetical protein